MTHLKPSDYQAALDDLPELVGSGSRRYYEPLDFLDWITRNFKTVLDSLTICAALPISECNHPIMWRCEHCDALPGDAAGMNSPDSSKRGDEGAEMTDLLDPHMPDQELRLHMGEVTADQVRVARAAIAWANSYVTQKGD